MKHFSNTIQKNADGTFNLSLTIYFKTQYIFYIGIILSFLTAFLYLFLAKKLFK